MANSLNFNNCFSVIDFFIFSKNSATLTSSFLKLFFNKTVDKNFLKSIISILF
ncbi:Uncharacterised protein [Chlamydia trachomatis]|nr:Uncharacterised protein [Chlamydia trachomatis]